MRTESPDIAIVGVGPAGMAAAGQAHASGASILLIDDNPSPGGQIWRGRTKNKRLEQFEPLKRWTVNNSRVLSAGASPLHLVVESADQAFAVTPQKLIICSGAREIFLPFPGWTLPGVFGVGGLQALVKSGLPVAGKQIVVAGSGPLLLAVAAYLKRHLAHVRVIAEQAPFLKVLGFGASLVMQPSKLMQAAVLKSDLRHVLQLQNCWIEEAVGTTRLEGVRLRWGRRKLDVPCDYAAVAYGLYPNTELASLVGCEVIGTAVKVDELQRTSVENIYCAGECTGIGGVDLSIVEGDIAGYAAAEETDKARRLFARRDRAQSFANALNVTFALRDELKSLARPDTIICRCEDVTFERLQHVASFREAKLHTRCGMGPCQGRVCGPAADFLFGWRTESIRPPVFPSRLGTLAVCNGKE